MPRLAPLSVAVPALLLFAAWYPAARPVVRSGAGFLGSDSCRSCHSNADRASAMRDEDDRPISPFDLWRSSMMANSARDPFWRAAVSAEVAAIPSRQREIEAKCMRCHTPMAGTEPAPSMALLSADTPRARLALDGVSCTVCHRIDDVDLGEPASFSGQFTIDDGDRLFGPHADPFAHPMVMHTGLVPAPATHVTSSALCATCHTLFTDTLDADGTATGHSYAEQSPYLEWRNSKFNDELDEPGPDAASCQDCHVPTTSVDGEDLRTRIARNPRGRNFPPTRPRTPYGRHVFVGGNTLIPAMLRDHTEELGIEAPRDAFDATIAAARVQLTERTARLEIVEAVRDHDHVTVSVRVENLAGHKFPSAYPSRRAWLRLQVLDATRASLFVSGDHDASGTIVGAEGRPLSSELVGGPVAEHEDRITRADQVQIYEVVMQSAEGDPTYRLMRAAANHKDNRLLPAGWRADHPDAQHTSPVGTGGDTNFVAARDEVTYRVALPDSEGPLHIEVDLLYQTLGARYAAELFRWRTPEVAGFERMWRAADRTPETVARATARID